MRKAILIAISILCMAQIGFAQDDKTLKKRVRILERQVTELHERIAEIEEVIEMTKATEDEYATLEEGADDPIEPGDIKVIRGTLLELDDCDAITNWSVHSGAGVTIAPENTKVYEGIGSVKVTIPAGVTAVIKCTGGPWDISSHKYLKASLFLQSIGSMANTNVHFGEAAYNEQNMGVFTLTLGSWKHKSWDISAIAAASRNGVTLFAVTLPNASAATASVFIDYVYADPGPSQVKAFDGDRVITLYPKVYASSYSGTGSAHDITIPRKGTPARIQIDHMERPTVLWVTGMASTHSKQMAEDTADGSHPIADETDMITAVGDCYFTLGTDIRVNGNGETYFYTVWWND